FKDFVADLKFVESSELSNKCICGFKFSSITIDPIKYLLFLFNNLKEKNVTFIKQKVKKLELDSFDGIVIDCDNTEVEPEINKKYISLVKSYFDKDITFNKSTVELRPYSNENLIYFDSKFYHTTRLSRNDY
ncbi:15361_t:CDS:2, partial [Cetraspora pellucida]